MRNRCRHGRLGRWRRIQLGRVREQCLDRLERRDHLLRQYRRRLDSIGLAHHRRSNGVQVAETLRCQERHGAGGNDERVVRRERVTGRTMDICGDRLGGRIHSIRWSASHVHIDGNRVGETALAVRTRSGVGARVAENWSLLSGNTEPAMTVSLAVHPERHDDCGLRPERSEEGDARDAPRQCEIPLRPREYKVRVARRSDGAPQANRQPSDHRDNGAEVFAALPPKLNPWRPGSAHVAHQPRKIRMYAFIRPFVFVVPTLDPLIPSCSCYSTVFKLCLVSSPPDRVH